MYHKSSNRYKIQVGTHTSKKTINGLREAFRLVLCERRRQLGPRAPNLFAPCKLFSRSIKRKSFYKHVLLVVLTLKGFLYRRSLVKH